MSEMLQQSDDGRWEPAVPMPLYITRRLGLVKRYGCMCRAEFRTEHEYEAHYRSNHIEPADD